MRRLIRAGLAVFLCALVMLVSRPAGAVVYRLEGHGILDDSSPPYGVDGEDITITADLDPDDFYYWPSTGDTWHEAAPLVTVPLQVVGSVSGTFPNIAPISRIVALELTEDPGVVDQIHVDIQSEFVSTSIVTSYCEFDSCFDGSAGPTTPTQVLDLLKEAINNTDSWHSSDIFGLLLADSDDSILMNDFTWTVERFPPEGGSTTARILPTFDVQWTADEVPFSIETGTPSLTEGGTSFIIGNGYYSPEKRAILEFPIDDIPANATIDAVTLQLDPYVSSGEPRLQVLGYAGDGVASVYDAYPPAALLAETNPMTAGVSTAEINLGTEYLQSLLGEASHMGVWIRGLDIIDYIGFLASEASYANPKPTLLVQYTVPVGLTGDYNGDGIVDAADYTVWRDTLGDNVTLGTGADGDGDGTIGAGDYLAWKQNFGATSSGALAQTATVPEPAAAMLFTIAVAAMLLNRPSPRRPC